MGLKRKYSDDDSPLSISSYGAAVSTPEEQSPISFIQSFDGVMDTSSDPSSRSHHWDFRTASRVKGADWGNRTRKRFRDNRPDERLIHENTLNKLFAAQRKHAHVSPVPSDPMPTLQTPATKPQKSTLHSFWKQLPAPPVQSVSFPISVQHHVQVPRCDDCDALLLQTNDTMDMDVDMDLDAPMASNPLRVLTVARTYVLPVPSFQQAGIAYSVPHNQDTR